MCARARKYKDKDEFECNYIVINLFITIKHITCQLTTCTVSGTVWTIEIPRRHPCRHNVSSALKHTRVMVNTYIYIYIYVWHLVYIRFPALSWSQCGILTTLRCDTMCVVMTVAWILSGRRSERHLGHASTWGAVGGRFLTCTELKI